MRAADLVGRKPWKWKWPSARPEADSAAKRYGNRFLVADFDGDPARLTEMDAVIAYLQSLGTLTRAAWSVAGEDKK